MSHAHEHAWSTGPVMRELARKHMCMRADTNDKRMDMSMHGRCAQQRARKCMYMRADTSDKPMDMSMRDRCIQ